MTTLYLALMFIAIVSLSITGSAIVRRKVSIQLLKSQHEVAGFIIAVLGAVYGVLLAFAVILVWGQFEDARNSVASESSALIDLMLLSKGLPAPYPDRAQIAIQRYTEAVISDEWKTMANSSASMKAQSALDELWQLYRSIEIANASRNAVYGECLELMRRISDDRRARIYASQDHVPLLVWVVLWVGAVVTVTFTYFFGVENFRSQALMTGALSGEIALILFLVVALDNPFRGDFRLRPAPFEFVLKRLSSIQ